MVPWALCELKSPGNLPLPGKPPPLFLEGVRKDSDEKAMSGPRRPGTDPHTPQGEVRWGKCLGWSQAYLGQGMSWPSVLAGDQPAEPRPPACLPPGHSCSALPTTATTFFQEELGCLQNP